MGAFLFTTMKENSTIQTLKMWVFPTLVSILAMMIWNDVTEIKADVKLLMAQSNVDKTRIDNLEREVYKKTASTPYNPPVTPAVIEYVAVLPNKDLLKQNNYEEVLP